MKKIVTVSLFCLGFLFSSIASVQAASSVELSAKKAAAQKIAARKIDKNPANYLFVQIVPEASLKQVVGKPGLYTLTLKEVSNKLEYFSARPERVSGLVSVQKFLTVWEKGFSTVTPKAAVLGLDKNPRQKKSVSLMVELSHPIYSHDLKTMTYEARLLPGEKSTIKSMELAALALFIDDYCPSCAASGF